MAQQKGAFSKSVHKYLKNEPPKISERAVVAEFDWKYHIIFQYEMGQWYVKTSLLNYWNDLVLGSVETYFLDVDAYLSLEQATTSG